MHCTSLNLTIKMKYLNAISLFFCSNNAQTFRTFRNIEKKSFILRDSSVYLYSAQCHSCEVAKSNKAIISFRKTPSQVAHWNTRMDAWRSFVDVKNTYPVYLILRFNETYRPRPTRLRCALNRKPSRSWQKEESRAPSSRNFLIFTWLLRGKACLLK